MTITLLKWFFFSGFVFFVPLLLLGTIRKIKARLQTRVGAPVTQPLWDVIKWLRKGETISGVATWIFRSTSAVNLVVILIIAAIVPWTSLKPVVPGADFFLVVYLLALSRFFTVLSALDAGSAFGGFAASREVTIALLVEPAIVLCLAALGCAAHTSDLSVVFSMGPLASVTQPSIWFLAGCALFLSSLVELSRMPVDDPTTHLELTMVHEAMILENSGKNLALTEYASCLKMAVMLGLCGQCFLHAVTAVSFHATPSVDGLVGRLPEVLTHGKLVLDAGSVFLLFVVAGVVAVIEGTAVKLRWTKVPEFIAYPVGIGLLCILIAIGGK